MSVPQSTEPVAEQESVSDVLQRLERTYIERADEFNAAKEQLAKNQEQVIETQSAAFKAYQILSVSKEKYLLTVIQNQNARLKQGSDEPARTPGSSTQPLASVIEEPRQNNVESNY